MIGAGNVPMNPNIFTFLERRFAGAAWASLLKEWESIIFSVIAAGILTLIFYLGTRKKEKVPTGFQNFMEWLVEMFRTFVRGVLGPEGDEYVPFLGTLFLYILIMNLLGVVPLMSPPSANLNITVAMALCVFGMVQYLNVKNMGWKGYLHSLAGHPTNLLGWIISPLLFPIELITQISRPFTLALRLFGNILGEKILVAFFSAAGIALFYFFPAQLPFMLFGVFMGLIQAMVFTLLSTIYILLSVPHAEEIHVKH